MVIAVEGFGRVSHVVTFKVPLVAGGAAGKSGSESGDQVTAEVTARGAAFVAGRIMLRRIEELARVREVFAFESTLAGRSVRHGFEIAPGQPFYATCVYTQCAYN
jgi:hypothetical protein